MIISSSAPKVKLGAQIKRVGCSHEKSALHCGKNTGETPRLREIPKSRIPREGRVSNPPFPEQD